MGQELEGTEGGNGSQPRSSPTQAPKVPASRDRRYRRQLSGRSLDPGSNAGARRMIATSDIHRGTEFGLQACSRFFYCNQIIFVASENVRYTGGLATAIPAGAEISIVPAISGG